MRTAVESYQAMTSSTLGTLCLDMYIIYSYPVFTSNLGSGIYTAYRITLCTKIRCAARFVYKGLEIFPLLPTYHVLGIGTRPYIIGMPSRYEIFCRLF